MTRDRSELLKAYRWPAAFMVSSVVLGGSIVTVALIAIRFLSEPIPIRIDGGLEVDRLVMPPMLTIRTDQPLPVMGEVGVKDQVQISGEAPLAIRGPITVREIKSPVQVSGNVRTQAEVTAIQAPVQADVTVKDQLSIAVQDQLNVDAQVRIEGSVNVEGDVDAEVKPRLLR